MKAEVYNINGQATGRTIELPEDIFGIEPNEHVIYLAVKQYLAGRRSGTHKTLEKSELSGSTRKLHKQKGTSGGLSTICGKSFAVMSSNRTCGSFFLNDCK